MSDIYAQEVSPDHYVFFYILFIVLQLKFPFEYKSIGFNSLRVTSWVKNLILGILALMTVTWTSHLIKATLPKDSFILADFQNNFWLSFGVLFFYLDFATFICHWASHKIIFLWKVHSLHHFDSYVDALTTARFHPIEGLFYGIILSFPHLFFVFDPKAVFIVVGVAIFFSVYIHSDFRIPYKIEKMIGVVFMTSGHHLKHHDKSETYRNSNFGLLLTLFDRLFKTYSPPEDNIHYNYGYENYCAEKTSLWDLIVISPQKDTTL